MHFSNKVSPSNFNSGFQSAWIQHVPVKFRQEHVSFMGQNQFFGHISGRDRRQPHLQSIASISVTQKFTSRNRRPEPCLCVDKKGVTQFRGPLEARDWKCWKEATGSAWLQKNKPHAEA